MSGNNRADRSPYAIMVIILIVGIPSGAWIWYASAAYTRHAVHAEGEAQEAYDAAEQYVKRTCTGLDADAAFVCMYDAVEAAQEKKTSEYDLAAQRQMADWSFWMALAAMLGLGATLVGVYFVWGTLETANRTAEIAGRAYAADHRTWLKLSATDVGPVTYDGTKFRVRFSVVAENIGNAPAESVHYDSKQIHALRYVAGKTALDSLLNFHKVIVQHSDRFGIILLPGDTHEYRFSGDTTSDPATDDLNRNAEESFARLTEEGTVPPAGSHNLSIAFCVSYLTPGSDERHHSGHVVWITRKDTIQWTVGETVQSDNLRIRLMTMDSVID